MRSRRRLALVLVCALLLAGCWDRTEVEDTLFVASIGVDARDDEFLWTFRVAETEQLSLGMLTAGGPASGGLASGMISVQATSLQQALQLVQASMARVVSLEHVRWVGFGEDLARRGLAPILSQFLRHNEIRRGASVYVVRGADALEPFMNNRPVADVNPMKFFEGVRLVQKRFHMAPATQLHHLYARLSSPGVDPISAVVGVSQTAKQPHGSDLPPMDGRSLKAGEIPRNGGNPVEFIGAAVFQDDKLAGILSVDETAALLALRGEMGKVYKSVNDPNEEGVYITLRLHQENKPQYRAAFRGRRPTVHVKLQFEAELLSTPGKTDYSLPEHRRKLEQHIAQNHHGPLYKALVEQVYTQWGADPAGFGQLFRTRFATFDDWLAYRWHDRVRDLEVTVETDVLVRRFGMMFSSEIEHGEQGE